MMPEAPLARSQLWQSLPTERVVVRDVSLYDLFSGVDVAS
jgi:hypothetical protein